jgi:hypothetical protein
VDGGGAGAELCLDPTDSVMQLSHEHKVAHFIFKETPDFKSYSALMAVFNNLRGAMATRPTSILRSPADLKAFVQVILSPSLSVVSALCEVCPDSTKGTRVFHPPRIYWRRMRFVVCIGGGG